MRSAALGLALAWSFAAGAPASAGAGENTSHARARPSCDELLLALERGLGKDGLETSTYEQIFQENKPTVRETGRTAGAHGGRVVHFRLRGKGWASRASTMGFDVQGDPRWFLEIFGREAGAFFGFTLNGDELTLPDVAEFSGAIRAVNEELRRRGQEEIPVTYYPMPPGKNVKVGLYLERFIGARGLPVAPRGNHFVHDMAWHSGAIAFPGWFLAEVRGAAEYTASFAEHLKNKYAGAGEELAFAGRRYSYLIKLERTMGIDSGTAFVGAELANHSYHERLGVRTPLHTRFYQIASDLLPELNPGRPVPPRDEFADSLMKTLSADLNPSGMLDLTHTYRAMRALRYLDVRRDLVQFSAGYRGERFPGFDPNRRAPPAYDTQEAYLQALCASITRRRGEISDAAIALARRADPGRAGLSP